jgi:hypothetical protein
LPKLTRFSKICNFGNNCEPNSNNRNNRHCPYRRTGRCNIELPRPDFQNPDNPDSRVLPKPLAGFPYRRMKTIPDKTQAPTKRLNVSVFSIF